MTLKLIVSELWHVILAAVIATIIAVAMNIPAGIMWVGVYSMIFAVCELSLLIISYLIWPALANWYRNRMEAYRRNLELHNNMRDYLDERFYQSHEQGEWLNHEERH